MSSAQKPKIVNTARHIEKINNTGSLSIPQKQALIGGLRGAVKVYVQEADSTANATTTVGASTYLTTTTPLEAGRRYEFEITVRLTNGTAANGVKCGINLSGTQTSARCFGISQSYDESNTALTAGVIALSSGAYTLADAGAGAATMRFVGFIVPQNDGIFDVRFAENATGGGTAVLKRDSYMKIREVE